MPHHFPKSTVQAAAWCSTCNKETPHSVFDGRLGRCMNEHPHGGVKKREEEPPQMGLFAPRVHGALEMVESPAEPLTEDEIWGKKL